MKRPFSITQEPKRTQIEESMCNFFIERAEFVKDFNSSDPSYSYITYKKFKIHLDGFDRDFYFDISTYNWNYRGFIPSYENDKITNCGIYNFAYDFIKNFLFKMIRMYGCNNSMDLILEIFGEKYGKEILYSAVKNNLIATELICNYINLKFANGKEDE